MSGSNTDRLAEMAAEIERQADPRDKLALAQHATLIEAMAEIERLRARIAELSAFIAAMPTDDDTELRLHSALARIAELEGHAAVTFGTLEQPTPDLPTKIEHNIPPSAPPHDER